MIRVQPVMNSYIQIVGQAVVLSFGEVLEDRLHSVLTFSEISTEIKQFQVHIVIPTILRI
jgi:hypothetical protein